ncbi:hypothetical protein Golax_025563 [Gossypium laxum]|uniref:Uncharacterized protein n=1 Tax=Gossypium laxum TaxID=34288 RepID=A0A7J9B2Y8_9ROSI|nr:hypothetical protein [Gossypium laxum]
MKDLYTKFIWAQHEGRETMEKEWQTDEEFGTNRDIMELRNEGLIIKINSDWNYSTCRDTEPYLRHILKPRLATNLQEQNYKRSSNNKKKDLRQSKGFDPLMRNYKGVLEIATEREWNTLFLTLKELTIILVVQEFYLALKEREATGLYYEIRTHVKVRGVDVLVMIGSIFQFYDASYYYCDLMFKVDINQFENVDMEEILRSLIEGKEEWTYQSGTKLLVTFNQALMTTMSKIWMKFICLGILPTIDISNINLL